MSTDRPRHIVVPAGQELEVAEALAGPTIQLEPVCPLCGHVGASRVQRHRERDESAEIPCYLSWCAAHGVTAAARSHADMPRHEMVKQENGAWTSAWRFVGVRCGSCGYVSAESAFCRPTGPVYVPPELSSGSSDPASP